MTDAESILRRAWFETWLKKHETIHAVGLLEALPGSREDHAITRHRILWACNEAAHYIAAKDPNTAYRDKMVAQKKKLKKLQEAARVLASASKRGDMAMQYAFPDGEKSQVRLAYFGDAKHKDVLTMLSLWFDEFESKLKGPILELNGGPFLQNVALGNLLYAESKRGAGAKTSVATMLAFELTIYLRMHTAGRAKQGLQNGQTMPKVGMPCAPVVQAFVDASLGVIHENASPVSDLIRRVPQGVGLKQWPALSD